MAVAGLPRDADHAFELACQEPALRLVQKLLLLYDLEYSAGEQC